MAKSNWLFSLRQLATFARLVLKLKFVYATDRINFCKGNVCPLVFPVVVIGLDSIR